MRSLGELKRRTNLLPLGNESRLDQLRRAIRRLRLLRRTPRWEEIDWMGLRRLNDPEHIWDRATLPSVSSQTIVSVAVALILFAGGLHYYRGQPAPVETAAAPDLTAIQAMLGEIETARRFVLKIKVPGTEDYVTRTVGKAFEVESGGKSFVGQMVELSSGFRRTAYFEQTPLGLDFDAASFAGQSSIQWESILSGKFEALAGNPFIQNQQSNGAVGLCRVYVRPDDYYSPEFAPQDYLCVRIEDPSRTFSARAYARRGTSEALGLRRVFGTVSFATPDGLPGRKSWRERAMALHLTADTNSLYLGQPEFIIDEIDSFTWLVAGM